MKPSTSSPAPLNTSRYNYIRSVSSSTKRNRDNLNRWIHERSIKVIRPKIIQKWLNSYHFIQT
ncbi:MAG: 30S ribosomal protein S10, partial [Nitrososphaeraceae archaeon]